AHPACSTAEPAPQTGGPGSPGGGADDGDTNGPGHNLGVLVLITEANVSITDTEKIVELSEVHHERVRTRQHRPGVRVEDQTCVSISRVASGADGNTRLMAACQSSLVVSASLLESSMRVARWSMNALIRFSLVVVVAPPWCASAVAARPAHTLDMSTNTANRRRQPAGRPLGGAFATESKPGAGVSLDRRLAPRSESPTMVVKEAAIEAALALHRGDYTL